MTYNLQLLPLYKIHYVFTIARFLSCYLSENVNIINYTDINYYKLQHFKLRQLIT